MSQEDGGRQGDDTRFDLTKTSLAEIANELEQQLAAFKREHHLPETHAIYESPLSLDGMSGSELIPPNETRDADGQVREPGIPPDEHAGHNPFRFGSDFTALLAEGQDRAQEHRARLRQQFVAPKDLAPQKRQRSWRAELLACTGGFVVLAFGAAAAYWRYVPDNAVDEMPVIASVEIEPQTTAAETSSAGVSNEVSQPSTLIEQRRAEAAPKLASSQVKDTVSSGPIGLELTRAKVDRNPGTIASADHVTSNLELARAMADADLALANTLLSARPQAHFFDLEVTNTSNPSLPAVASPEVAAADVLPAEDSTAQDLIASDLDISPNPVAVQLVQLPTTKPPRSGEGDRSADSHSRPGGDTNGGAPSDNGDDGNAGSGSDGSGNGGSGTDSDGNGSDGGDNGDGSDGSGNGGSGTGSDGNGSDGGDNGDGSDGSDGSGDGGDGGDNGAGNGKGGKGKGGKGKGPKGKEGKGNGGDGD